MRIFRSSDEWRALILQQQDSGLSVADFCREHALATTSFYSSRARLFGKSPASSQFVQARFTEEFELRETVASTQAIEITLRELRLSLPATISPAYLTQLLRGLIA